jgi:hypothetical protein
LPFGKINEETPISWGYSRPNLICSHSPRVPGRRPSSAVHHFGIYTTQDLEREGRTCKTLDAEVKELRGEPQASTRGLTGVQMWQRRGLQCNVTTKSRGRSRLWPSGLQIKKQAMAKRPDCRKNPRDFVVAGAHTPRCGPLLLPHCTPVRPRVEAPREMTMHLLPVSPGPSVLPIPTATAPPNLPQQWWCSIAQCIAHRASTPEPRWPQINPREQCLGLQTPHCCTCAGPHARASPIALPAVPFCVGLGHG